MKIILICVLLSLGLLFPGIAGEKAGTPVPLPAPRLTRPGPTLMQALVNRKSTRAYRADPLPQEILSDLLWAAWGVNRPETGMRTAPSTKNWQEIDLYVATAEGLFLYEAGPHRLVPVLDRDIRKDTGFQDFAATVPVNLIYVVDFNRIRIEAVADATARDKEIFGAVDAAFISQNVYLYCAWAGLGTVVRGDLDKKKLAALMGLRTGQTVVLAQSVGYSAE